MTDKEPVHITKEFMSGAGAILEPGFNELKKQIENELLKEPRDFIEMIKKLDGMAAYNHMEPTLDDVNRIFKAYLEAKADRDRMEEHWRAACIATEGLSARVDQLEREVIKLKPRGSYGIFD